MHVLGEGMRMHRDFGVRIGAHELCAFHTDGLVTERCAFSGAGDDADVVRHKSDI